jgi:hypothetical protein
LVSNVTVMNAASGGLVTELGSSRVVVREFVAFGNAFDGLAGYDTQNSSFANLYLHHNGAAGLSFDLLFRNNSVSDAVLEANGTVGVFMRNAMNNLFAGLRIRDAGEHGVFLAQRDSDAATPAASNVFTGIVIQNSKGAAIFVADASCVNNVVSAASLSGNASCVLEAVPGLLKTAAVACQ